MKIIFLDVDGVLNSDKYFDRVPGYRANTKAVSEKLVKKLKKIVDATDAEIVMSSTWRIGWNNQKTERQEWLHYILQKNNLNIYDITPRRRDGIRGLEIRDWLLEHRDIVSVTGMVILDDDSFDIAPYYKTNFVHIDRKVGLTQKDVKKAIDMLNYFDKYSTEIPVKLN